MSANKVALNHIPYRPACMSPRYASQYWTNHAGRSSCTVSVSLGVINSTDALAPIVKSNSLRLLLRISQSFCLMKVEKMLQHHTAKSLCMLSRMPLSVVLLLKSGKCGQSYSCQILLTVWNRIYNYYNWTTITVSQMLYKVIRTKSARSSSGRTWFWWLS